MQSAEIDARRELLRRRFAVWRPRTLSDWLDECAARYRDRPIVLTHERTLTYGDIAAESRRLACGLAALGARFKVPKRVVFYRADDLPSTPTGKVQKFRLVQHLRAGDNLTKTRN